MSAPHIEDGTTDHTDDIAAIRQVIADAERAFNGNDAESRALFAGALRDQRARYQLADVLFVRPDVALAHKHATALDAAGRPASVGHAMTALYVLVREHGRWWVVARQNTLVPAT